MKLGLDAYAHLKSPIHRWEPRCKLVGLMGLIFVFSGVQALGLLPGMVGVAIALYIISQLPLSFLLRRLRYPGFFLFGAIALLPFISGNTVIWQFGVLTLRQEGCLAVILIAARFFSILTVALIAFGTATFSTSLKAMRGLGLPQVLADMMLLSYRYIEEFGDLFHRMKIAMRLRGFQVNKLSYRNLRMLAFLTGTLLVRSYERSERVYQAMRLRGYGEFRQRNGFQQQVRRGDIFALGVVLIVAVGFVFVEVFL